MSVYNMKTGQSDTSDLKNAIETINANGAITIPAYGSKTVMIVKGSAGAYTLAAPTADGIEISVVSTTAFAHTVTATTIGFNDGGAASDVATFGAAKGNGLTFVSYGGDWWVTCSVGITLA